MQPQGEHVQLGYGQQARLVGRAVSDSAWRRARSVEVTYGPSKKCEKAQPSGVSIGLRRGHGAVAAADQEAPAGEPGARCAPAGGDPVQYVDGQREFGGQRVPGRTRRAGVRASRTAVGEPSAARTLRRAGAGAGGTCSGMVGRLSLRETRWREGGVRTALSRAGSEGGRDWGRSGRGRQLSASFAEFIRHVFTQCFG